MGNASSLTSRQNRRSPLAQAVDAAKRPEPKAKRRSLSSIQTVKAVRNAQVHFNQLMRENTCEGTKMCLIFCEAYYGASYELGDPVLNDGILTHDTVKAFGFNTYMSFDDNRATFFDLFDKFIAHGYETLIVYYSGHRSRENNDDDLVATDGFIIDEDLKNKIDTLNKSGKLFLISDCCHSGTEYDLPVSDSVISISACKDDQTAAQLEYDGAFTKMFWPNVHEGDSIKTILDRINPHLAQYGQTAVSSNE